MAHIKCRYSRCECSEHGEYFIQGFEERCCSHEWPHYAIDECMYFSPDYAKIENAKRKRMAISDMECTNISKTHVEFEKTIHNYSLSIPAGEDSGFLSIEDYDWDGEDRFIWEHWIDYLEIDGRVLIVTEEGCDPD
jgi:hypothetical protein